MTSYSRNDNMHRPLFDQLKATDSALEALITADHDRARKLRHVLEELWATYAPYASRNWVDKAQMQFPSAIWEMYLTCGFLDAGYRVDASPKDVGPDIILTTERGPILIEAIVVTKGEVGKPDSVPGRGQEKSGDVPVDKIVMRYTSAISSKIAQHKQWRESGVIAGNGPYIIALAASPLDMQFSDTHPLVFKALAPMGHLQITINSKTMEKIREEHGYRDSFAKANNTIVPTTYFTSDAYSQVSAVIAARFDPWNNPLYEVGKYFPGFALVQNPFATAPIPMPLVPDAAHYQIVIDEKNISIGPVSFD